MSCGRELENVGGAWVEKNKERKDNVVRCKVEVEVEGACERIDFEMAVTG
jgi:hypothetical protein